MATNQIYVETEEEIRHGLDGNLCRCTGYRSILDAANELAEGRV